MNNGFNCTPYALQSTIKKSFYINIALAIFALLANGGALFLGLVSKSPEILTDYLLTVTLTITGATFVLASAVFAIVKPRYWKKILSIHATFLIILTVTPLFEGLNLAFKSPDDLLDFVEQSKVTMVWSVGWFTAMASYSAFLVSITFFEHVRHRSVIIKYAYLWVGAIAFFIDVFIFFRVAALLM
ncbi:MAG: hypothetical protein OEX19_11800 [Gammaproteobacteria bacterium]|nr:hypothetical protein [Gammaproteobacteria bacterium]